MAARTASQRATQAALRVERDIEAAKRRVAREIGQALTEARAEVIERLSRVHDGWNMVQARQLLVEVEHVMARFEATARSAAQAAAIETAQHGMDIIRAALDAGEPGVVLAPGIALDPAQITVAFSTFPEQISAVSRRVIEQVGTVLRRSVLGGLTPMEAMRQIGPITGSGPFATAFHRAETIVRTELHRISATATQAQLQQVAQHDPTLQKRWIANHDGRTRDAHARADGQIVGATERYRVWNEWLRYPGDPGATGKNVINCRCVSVPHRSTWP